MRDANGEDREKFTKEILGLGHMIGEPSVKGGIVVNDGTENPHQKRPLILDSMGHAIKKPKKGNKLNQSARLEEKSPRHKNNQIMKEAAKIKEWQTQMVNESIDNTLKDLLPKWAYWLCDKWEWRWHLTFLGIKIKFGKIQPGLMETTVVQIYVWGQPHTREILHWEV
jgi:hypothetical protein